MKKGKGIVDGIVSANEYTKPTEKAYSPNNSEITQADFLKWLNELSSKRYKTKMLVCQAGKGFCENMVKEHGIAMFLGCVEQGSIIPVGTGWDYYMELKKKADEQKK